MFKLDEVYLFDPNDSDKVRLFLEIMAKIRNRLEKSPDTILSWHGIKFSLIESEK